MRFALGILLLLLLWTQVARPTTTTIPFTLGRSGIGAPLILIHVEINGKPATLVVDSGAQLLGVRPSYLEGLPALGHTAIHGVGGVRLASAAWVNISVGTDTFHEVAVADAGPAGDGFLGQSVLNHYSKITIDYAAKTIILEK